RRAQRQLPAGAAAGRVRAAVRPPLHARVRAFGTQPQARARHHRARRRQAADGLRHPSADRLLPARRPGGADDRADRDRGEGAAGRVCRRDAADHPRGRRGSRAAAHGAAHAPGDEARRGARREGAGGQVRLRRPRRDPGGDGMSVTSGALVHELVGLSNELVRAVQERKPEQLETMLAREFTLLGAAGELDRDELIAAASGRYAIEDFGYEEIDPEVYGDTAVVVSRYSQT